MSDGRRGSLTGWVTLIGTVAALITAWVSCMGYLHPHGESSQSFSVSLNSPQEPGATGQHVPDKSLNFVRKKCDVGAKLVWCVLTVVSPHYDKRFMLWPNQSHLVDNEGDSFALEGLLLDTMLERDQPSTFKMSFPVNKNVVLPATGHMVFYADGIQYEKAFQVKDSE